jgi:hypothetical protein
MMDSQKPSRVPEDHSIPTCDPLARLVVELAGLEPATF